MYLYAQLDAENVCMGVSQLSGEVELPNMIQLTEAAYLAGGLIGRPYADGVWGEAETEEPTVGEEVDMHELMELQWVQLQALADLYESIVGEA